MNHWYQKPADLVTKNGELYLPGTQDTANCTRSSNSGTTPPTPGRGKANPKPPKGGGGGGGD